MKRSLVPVCAALAAVALYPLASGVMAQAPRAAQPAAAQPAYDEIRGMLADGTPWTVRKPANWNGTILLDLDGAGMLPSAPPPGYNPAAMPARPVSTTPFAGMKQWQFLQGYALGGTTREPVGYNFPQAVENLVEVRRQFIAKFGMPKRTLVTGGSRGGFVVRMAMELRPDIFEGAFTNFGGGAGEIAVLNNKLNAMFVMKTLIDPSSPMKLVNIETQPEVAALTALLDKAKTTPAARARFALATAVSQFPRWAIPTKPKPAPTDYDAQVDQALENYVFAAALPVRAGVEKVARGNVSWNTGVDYGALLRRSGRMAMVEEQYRKAGLDLAKDLATLAGAPRIKADPAAVRRAEPLMTYSGKIKGPIVNLDNDDIVDPASDKLAYVATLKRAGKQDLFRLIWTDAAGHGNQPEIDKAVAFTLLIRRLDSGKWGDTSLSALQALAAEIGRNSPVNLGASRLFDPGKLPDPVMIWDASKWGSYRG